MASMICGTGDKQVGSMIRLRLRNSCDDTGFVPVSSQFSIVGTFLTLNSPSWALSLAPKHVKCQCVSVEVQHPINPSVIVLSSSRSITRCPSEDQGPCRLISKKTPLRHLSLLRRTPLLPLSMLSSFAARSRFSPCATRPAVLFREIRSPAKSLST